MDVGAGLAFEAFPYPVDANVHEDTDAVLGHKGNGFAQGGVIPAAVPEGAADAERRVQIALGLELVGYPHVPVADAGEPLEVLSLEGFSYGGLHLHLLC